MKAFTLTSQQQRAQFRENISFSKAAQNKANTIFFNPDFQGESTQNVLSWLF